MMHLKYNKRQRRTQNARRRLLHFEQCEERLLLSVSSSGDAASELGLFASDASQKLAIRIRIETANATGTPISEAAVGDEFLVNVYVQDVREIAAGVFATYLDLLYDADLVLAGDVVRFGNGFPHGQTIDASIPGIIDEVGGFAAFKYSGPNEELLMSMPFVATRPGRVDFVGEQPDYVGSIPLVYGHNFGVPFDEVDFGRTTINVVARDLSEFGSLSTNVNSTSINTESAFQPVDSFRGATERYGSTDKLTEGYWSERHFATTQATRPLATNGGFNDLDGLRFDDRADFGIPISYEFDSESIRLGKEAVAFVMDSQLQDLVFSGGLGVRLEPSPGGIRRVAEDHFYTSDDVVHLRHLNQLASSTEVRAFTSAELPDWHETGLPIRPTTELATRSAPPLQVARAALADSTATTRDDSFREEDTQSVALSTPNGNGGYVNLADLRQIAQPKPVDAADIRAIQIARTDNPTSGEAARIPKGGSEIAMASLTWRLQVDGSRSVSLAFEMAEDPPAARGTQPTEIKGTVPSPRNDSGRSASPSEDSADPDTPIMPPKAKAVSFDFGNDGENVRDERRHNLAMSPLIVFVVGSLLVTEGWQKLQPREEKHKPR